ncbi:hypothetical protein ACTJIJ_15025 [Niabella sp. 22666]|uniref:hypothetical protein n=1 Tax=Niabella sp. 22666 TaxID=3453954 RepID=UPI003F86D2E1
MNRIYKLLAYTCFYLLISTPKSFSQVNAGDMIVLGIDAYSDNDKITFATLVDIPQGTVIKITDRGWTNATQSFITPAAPGDGIVTWTTSTLIRAGDIFTLAIGGSDNLPVTNLTNVTRSVNMTADISVTGFTVGQAMLGNGEQVFIYRGDDTNPYFIFGLNASRNVNLNANFWQTSITATAVESMFPDGRGSLNTLINGVNALGVLTNPGAATNFEQQFDNVFYSGPTSQTNRAGWLARIANPTNWSGDDNGSGVTSIGTTIGTSAVALPVTFGVISATNNEDGYTLSWQTLQETNNDHFEVEASRDGNEFTTIAKVPTKADGGNSNVSQHYSISFGKGSLPALLGGSLLSLLLLAAQGKSRRRKVMTGLVLALTISWIGCTKGETLENPVEKIYVRIAQVDKDGTRSYSKVIAVNAGK